MRMTPEQIRERFEREVQSASCVCGRDRRYVVHVEDALVFALRLAADLQAPPTGEEVEHLRAAIMAKSATIEKQAYRETRECNGGCANKAAWDDFESAVHAYGAACFAAGRAEGGKAADVLKRLAEACGRDAREIHVFPSGVGYRCEICQLSCDPIHGTEAQTPADAIAAALDQLGTKSSQQEL